jgi:hypothetical protein
MDEFKRFLQREIGGLLEMVKTTEDSHEFVLSGVEKSVSDRELVRLVERFYGRRVVAKGSLRITVMSPKGSLPTLITMTNLTSYGESPLLGVRMIKVGKGLQRALSV